MVARYLTSDFQRALIASIDEMDRTEVDFFIISPLVIDCRDDGPAFSAALSKVQRDFIAWQHERKDLRFVSGLARPGYQYAWQKLREKFDLLDVSAKKAVQSFLREWSHEIGIQPNQQSKAQLDLSSGIDIVLPQSGIRLSYDHSVVMML